MKKHINNTFIMLRNVPEPWLSIIKGIANPSFDETIAQIPNADLPHLCPTEGNVMNVFRKTPWEALHTIILGQDPYHSLMNNELDMPTPIADGLAFSSKATTTPPSLRNIFGALQKSNLIATTPMINDLTMWCQHGVLLLNTALTTIDGTAEKHIKIWHPFVINLIREIINRKHDQMTICLWGGKAQTLWKAVASPHPIEVLTYSHPSPLGNNKLPADQRFINCDHFTRISVKNQRMNWNPMMRQLIFTDGSHSKKANSGGYAFVVFYGAFHGLVKYGTSPSPSTNQVSEGIALVKAIEFINTHNLHNVLVITDSQFYINVITDWMYKWYAIDSSLSKKSDGEPIKNRQIIMTLFKNWNMAKERNTMLEHVRSHQLEPSQTTREERIAYVKWYGNKLADQFAGMKPPTEQTKYAF